MLQHNSYIYVLGHVGDDNARVGDGGGDGVDDERDGIGGLDGARARQEAAFLCRPMFANGLLPHPHQLSLS